MHPYLSLILGFAVVLIANAHMKRQGEKRLAELRAARDAEQRQLSADCLCWRGE